MPVIHRHHGFRFYFYADEGHEPPHIHVSKGGARGKWWLEPMERVYAEGFSPRQLRMIEDVIAEQRSSFVEAWHGFFEV